MVKAAHSSNREVSICIVALAALVVLAGAAWAGGEARPTPLVVNATNDPLDRVTFFVPNDPCYAPYQWHLANPSGYPSINVVGAWAQGITGSGVVVAVVDDSMQTDHPDLAPNYTAADSWDFGQNDGSPDPVYADDNHGTATSGLIAARGGNGIGLTGVAPMASLACLRIDFALQTEQMFADATLYHSSGADTSIKVKNHSYGISVPFVDTAIEAAAVVTSASAGTIHTFSAGNERTIHGWYWDMDGSGDFTPDVDWAADGDSNKKHLQSLQETITVAALGADGVYASYVSDTYRWGSNWGACVWVTAPSSSGEGLPGIATTDRTGAAGYNDGTDPIGNADYTSDFGGTSASAPIVAGVMALGKEVNPAMEVRMAKHLLVKTCTIIDPTDSSVESDGGWKVNAAGNVFNQNYGFGLIDANAFCLAAAKWDGVTALVTESTGLIDVDEAIPDAGLGSNTQYFDLLTAGQLEEVEVYLDITHTWRGDLEAYLTSPSGTTCRLMMKNGADSFDDIDWTFTANTFWGEDPVGEWMLQLVDNYVGDTGMWNSFSVLAKTGELVPEPGTLLLLAAGAAGLLRRRRTA